MFKKYIIPSRYQRLLSSICLLFIVAVALYYRLDFIHTVTHIPSPDATNYANMAIQLVEKGVYGYASTEPNAYIAPGYPVFLALNYLAADFFNWDALLLTRYIQVTLSLFILVMVYLITKRLSSNTIIALLAAFITAIYPPFVYANGAILTEVLCTFFLVLYVMWCLYSMERLSRIHAITAGVLLGLTVLVRPEFLPLLVIPSLFLWWKTKQAKVWIFLGWTVLGFAIALMPWWIRNMVTMHEFIPLATQSNPLVSGTFPYNQFDDDMVDMTGKSDKRITLERLYVGFTEHTLLYIWWFTAGKLEYIYPVMFYGGGFQPGYMVIRWANLLHQAIVWFGAGAILLSMFQLKKTYNVITLVIIVMTMIRLVFVPEYRYNFYMMPLFIILIGVVFQQIITLIRKNKIEERQD